MITLTGKKVSEGIAIGRLSFYKRSSKEVRKICVDNVERELHRFQLSCVKAIRELEELCEEMVPMIGEINAATFEMQILVLDDSDFTNEVEEYIRETKLNAEYAVAEVTMRFVRRIAQRNPDYVNIHEEDVKDAASRLLRILTHTRKEKLLVDEPFILATNELYPSESAQIDVNQVMGEVLMYGKLNSHSSAIARTKEIPCVIGVGEALKKEYEGKLVIVDGFAGKIYIEPDQKTLTMMEKKKATTVRKTETLERLKGKENITQSGRKIDVCGNINNREDIENVIKNDANGVGLLRSEYIFHMAGNKFPTEDEQFKYYKLAAETMGNLPIVIRVADIGGDKPVECLDISGESNPLMGYRGIRVLLDKQEVFRTQLRAILRATEYGHVRIMLPMISSIEEVKESKRIIEQVKAELRNERIAFREDTQIGVMIETPAAVMISGELAREVDFLSIGTNDLTQYTLAMDRSNRRIIGYYNPTHPAIIKMIRIVANNVQLEGKRISVCGELAADLSMTEQFINMGIDELSVSPNQILPLRKHIREIR